jgi:ATP-dependent Clp protease, protease subunit
VNPVPYIYDEIGDGFGAKPVLARAVADEIDKIKKAGHRAVDVRINSPGGEVFTAITIHNMLMRSELDVTAYVDGLAASAASIVLMAGRRRIAESSGIVMVHQAWTIAAGNASDFEQAAKELRTVDDAIVGIFVARTGQPADKIRELLAAETWMSAEAALEHGFVDEIASTAEEQPAITGRRESKRMREARAALARNEATLQKPAREWRSPD